MKIPFLVIVGLLVLMSCSSSLAESSLCPVKVEVRHGTLDNPVAGTFYSNVGAACPGSVGASSTEAVEVNPGENICYSFTYTNNGSISIPARTYTVYSRAIGLHTVSNDAFSSRWDSVYAGMPSGELPPGASITLSACATILDSAPPCKAIIHSYAVKTDADGNAIGTFTKSWHNYAWPLRVLNSPAFDYVNATVSFGAVTWNPPGAYSAATNTYDLSFITAFAPSYIVRSRAITVRNHASSEANFNGNVVGSYFPQIPIVNLAPGAQITVYPNWTKDNFVSSPAGIISVTSCLYDSTPKFIDCDWQSITTLSATDASMLISVFETDDATYDAGETGTLYLRLTNFGPTLGAGSTVDVSLRNDVPPGEVLPVTTQSLGALPYGTSATVSVPFTVPASMPFMANFTICLDLNLQNSGGAPFSQVNLYSSTWSPPLDTTRYCKSIRLAIPIGATCNPPAPAGNPPQQNCSCATSYCTLTAPKGMIITSVDYPASAGRVLNVVDRGQVYMTNAAGAWIKLEYMVAVVPSMELNILAVLLITFVAFFFYTHRRGR